MMQNHSHSIRARRRRIAFSMAEMLVVLVIIGTISAVAVPRYSQASSRQRLDGAVRRLMTDLNTASEHARFTCKSVTVRFYLNTHMYRVPLMVDLDHRAGAYEVKLFEDPYMTKIIAADFGGIEKLTYDGYGEIVTAGYIDLQVGNLTKRINVSNGLLQVAVPVAIN